MSKRSAEISSQSSVKKSKSPSVPQVLLAPPKLHHANYTAAELRAMVAENGFAVIEGVLDDADALAYCNDLFAAYASIYDANSGTQEPLGFDLRAPTTLDKGNTPPYKGSGMVAVDGTSGLRVLKRLALDARVARVYERYYGVASAAELAKSNDRWGVMLPNKTRTELEPHLDANVLHAERAQQEDVLQGFVVLQAGCKPDQGLTLYPGHHNDIGKWRDESAIERDYFPIPEHRRAELGRGVVINAPRGSMVVWRSTVPHGNTSGAGAKTVCGRVVAYICMYPWSRMSDAAKDALERAIVEHTTLSHTLLRPTAQKTGAVRYGPKLKWRYGAAHLVDYKSVQDLPPGLRRPPTNISI